MEGIHPLWLTAIPGQPAGFMTRGARMHFRPLLTVTSGPYNV
jgi:hypothetical protein